MFKKMLVWIFSVANDQNIGYMKKLPNCKIEGGRFIVNDGNLWFLDVINSNIFFKGTSFILRGVFEMKKSDVKRFSNCKIEEAIWS